MTKIYSVPLCGFLGKKKKKKKRKDYGPVVKQNTDRKKLRMKET